MSAAPVWITRIVSALVLLALLALVNSVPGQQVPDGSDDDIFMPYVLIPIGTDLWDFARGAAVAIGDLNGDGRNDIALSTSFGFGSPSDTDTSLYVFLQNSQGGLEPPLRYPGAIWSVAICDANRDGRNDVVASGSGSLRVFYQDGDGQLGQPVVYPSNRGGLSALWRIRTGDLNHDGRCDVAATTYLGAGVEIYFQDDTGELEPPIVVPLGYGHQNDLEVEDFNSDALDDIVVGSPGQFGLLMQRPEGGFLPPVYHSFLSETNYGGIGAGDVNGDGLTDVVVTHFGPGYSSDSISVFAQGLPGQFSRQSTYDTWMGPLAVEAADLNGDSLEDVIVLHDLLNYLGVFLQDHSGSLRQERLYRVGFGNSENTHSLAVGDVNSDGQNDLAVADFIGLCVLYHIPPPESIQVDLLPRQCPNRISISNDLTIPGLRPSPAAAAPRKPEVPLAILGRPDFDVTDIEYSSALLEGIAPTRSVLADVTAPLPVRESGDCECMALPPDGYTDLVLYFDQTALLSSQEPWNAGEMRKLKLTARQKDRTPLIGTDCALLDSGITRLYARDDGGGAASERLTSSPNPFNASTTIGFSLPSEDHVRLDVFDILGRHVTTLLDDVRPGGNHAIVWQGAGDDGGAVASGIYFCRMTTSGTSATRKLLLLR